ncbi:hypothetical protein MMC16_002923 [Acarospora aff. strigata]|nr:hypothetical protein [Acarospora aff. strigata]
MADTEPTANGVEPSAITIPQSFLRASDNRLTAEQIDAFLASSTRPSFFYGSLMFPKIVSDVTWRNDVDSIIKRMTPAVLPRHQRYVVSWADFPAVLPSDEPGDSVRGMLLFGLNEQENARIENYESGLYTMEHAQVEVVLSDGNTRLVVADVFIWKNPRGELIEVQDRLWSIEGFVDGRFYDDRFA